jgi:hypothetical protein
MFRKHQRKHFHFPVKSLPGFFSLAASLLAGLFASNPLSHIPHPVCGGSGDFPGRRFSGQNKFNVVSEAG